MNENETRTDQTSDIPESETPVHEDTPVAAQLEPAPETPQKSSRVVGYVAAGLVVVLGLIGVLYLLEKEGRSSTGIFDSLLEQQQAGAVVATVNGQEIVNRELATSIQQFSQAAAAQGVDTTTPSAQAEIRNQALDVLINTELLRQRAIEEGFEVTEEEAAERLATIEVEIGGPEVLAERMAVLGIDTEGLQSDIRDELLIQRLLDSIFASAGLEATDEEIAEVYANAGGEEAGLPPLVEVSEQVSAQIIASKEQQVVDEYLSELRANAEIERE